MLAVCVIVSICGGGFATIPAYLADTFGTQFVGAIHGRLLTAWSTAGIIGPVLVNYIREAQIAAGVPRQQVCDFTMYILAGLLLLGLIANALGETARRQRWFTSGEEIRRQFELPTHRATWDSGIRDLGVGISAPRVAWAAVGDSDRVGVWVTLAQALVLFSGGA